MKIIFTIIIIALFICGSLLFFYNVELNTAANQVKAKSPAAHLPFEKGERLIYDIYLKGLKIGQSILTFHGEKNINQKKSYHITFETKAPFFKDTEQIYAAKDTFLPLKVERTLKNAIGFTTKITEAYDQENFTVDITKQGSRTSTTKRFKKSGPISNAILLTYYCRVNPEIARSKTYKVILPTSEYSVLISGEETLETSSATYPVTVYSSTPNKFTFYLNTDKKKIPIKISSHTALDYTLVLNSKESEDALGQTEG